MRLKSFIFIAALLLTGTAPKTAPKSKVRPTAKQANANGQKVRGRVPASTALSAEEIQEIKALLKIWRETKQPPEAQGGVAKRLNQLEESMDKYDTELEILQEQNRLMIRRTTLGFRDMTFLKLGVAIVMPRARSFTFNTDTGMGGFFGVGHHFGKHSVLELSADWDLYPAVSLRYRYEFQSSLPAFTWGPIIGIKAKVAKSKPLDDFLDKPDELKSTFWIVGGMVGFPIARSLLAIELLYLTNQQSFFFAQGAFHFFL